MPHDAGWKRSAVARFHAEGREGVSVHDLFEARGINQVDVVERISKKALGLEWANSFCRRAVFHKTNCATDPHTGDGWKTALVSCLENVRRHQKNTGKGGSVILDEPTGDEAHAYDCVELAGRVLCPGTQSVDILEGMGAVDENDGWGSV